eukprot:1861706-Prymnesium_polylepis.1
MRPSLSQRPSLSLSLSPSLTLSPSITLTPPSTCAPPSPCAPPWAPRRASHLQHAPLGVVCHPAQQVVDAPRELAQDGVERRTSHQVDVAVGERAHRVGARAAQHDAYVAKVGASREVAPAHNGARSSAQSGQHAHHSRTVVGSNGAAGYATPPACVGNTSTTPRLMMKRSRDSSPTRTSVSPGRQGGDDGVFVEAHCGAPEVVEVVKYAVLQLLREVVVVHVGLGGLDAELVLCVRGVRVEEEGREHRDETRVEQDREQQQGDHHGRLTLADDRDVAKAARGDGRESPVDRPQVGHLWPVLHLALHR